MNRTARRISISTRMARPVTVGHSSNVVVLQRKPRPKPAPDDFPYQLLWEDGDEILWEDGDAMLWENAGVIEVPSDIPAAAFLADDGTAFQFDDNEYLEADG